MVTIEHGDLIEQRRGGVDVLRVLVRNLAVHEQSGAVLIRSSSGGASTGWLLFRLGQPVMAFYSGVDDRMGLEALLSIEHDALAVENELLLYELSMNALRETMSKHPSSVLHLEHQEQRADSESWWSSVRLPSSSWRRAARLEDIEAMALETEERQRSIPGTSAVHPVLEPGCVYLLDSPDPHPMIQLGVELAERGMPLMGLFGLPHAQTEHTSRLPQPHCYALLSPHGGYNVLDDRAALDTVVNAFQWGNERSVILLDGLDRIGNAFGEGTMVDVVRSVCDGVRFNDHVALITTDLELFETTVQRRLLSETTQLRPHLIEAWNREPDALWDHPILLAPDEEEEQWLAAQIQHQGAKVGAVPHDQPNQLEGGSYEPDAEERARAVRALSDVVEAWPETESTEEQASEPPTVPVSVGEQPWRPVQTPTVNPGRFVSDSPRAPAEEAAPPQPYLRVRARRKPTPVTVLPKPRPAQRMARRKPEPALPTIAPGLTPSRSAAVTDSAPDLPDWPTKSKAKQAYRRENMEVFAQKQTLAQQRQSVISAPVQTKALKDSAARSPNLEGAALPEPTVPQTVNLPSTSTDEPLTNSLRPVAPTSKPAREAAQKTQRNVDMEDIYERWSTFEDSEGMDSTALYDELGEALQRYKGDEP